MPRVREDGKGRVCHKEGEGIKGLSPDSGRGADAGVKEEITHAKDAKDAKTGGLRICEGG